MKTAALITTDSALTSALQSAAAQADLLLVTTSMAEGVGGPLLVQQEGQQPALHCYPDGLATAPTILPLPVRIGTVIDWLLRQQHRVAAIELGTSGRLEVQARRLVRPDGSHIALTEKEVEIIACLAEAAAPIPREQLMRGVWGYSREIDTHTLETHIYRLRQKLEAAGIDALLLSGEAGYYLARD